MTRKFKQNLDVWCNYGAFRYRRGDVDGARALLQRAMQSMPKRDHPILVTKYAINEYRHGSPERGRSLFEGIVASHPKRTDVWSIYSDMELTHGDPTTIRRLFDRMIALNLSAKKIKVFFKKYLDYENKYGTEQTVEQVRQKAREYVASKSNQ
eukprot:TRINITY_DN3790_c0_g4_i1.p1 TRINITY_DN3790_c0_g4~~TRINITY_DN3790_c0_g4_i1.p1  ORF type:complete len:153 (+),score=50.27 TRINITY_DN3790_c0_g4_i1:70-528(+)